MSRPLIGCVLFSSLLGCVGIVGDPGEPAAAAESAPNAPGGAGNLPPGACLDASPARLWRLSHEQYDNTVRDLLGVDLRSGEGFEPEGSGTGFRNGSGVAFVSTTLAEQYMLASEAVAELAVASLDALLPCTPADPANRDCVVAFVDEFGARAFRKPVTEEQRSIYLDLYDEGTRVEDATIGLSMVVSAILQSPHFLYRFEIGGDATGSEPSVLTPWETASALSYLLWDTMPDEELFARAEDGTLSTPEGVASEAERMVEDPRARRVLWDFFQQYLGLGQVASLDKDPALFPEFGLALTASLDAEAHALVDYVAWDQRGSLAELFTADYGFVDERTAELYGVPGIRGDRLTRVSFDPQERAGLITHAGLLARLGDRESGSPTFRGLFVRTQLLCQEVPDPPMDVADVVEPPDESRTTRERYEVHVHSERCATCHEYIDPIGFGFESYDGIGRFRTEENGFPVDDSGTIVGTDDIDGDFVGARELADRLASTRQVSDCVARHFFRYAMGRLERESDSCELERIQTAFAASETNLVGLLREVLASSSFRHRMPAEEASP